jgi:multiple sugar transport system substrate-binding protein
VERRSRCAGNAGPTGRFLDLYADLYKTMPAGMNTVSYAELMSLFATERLRIPSIRAA